MRLTASSAIGETGLPLRPSLAFFSMSARSKKPRRAWASKTPRDRHRFLLRVEQRLEAAIAIGLQDAGEGSQMLLGMFASSVARGVIDRSRRRRPTVGPIVAHIGPDPAGRALALCQDADGGVVAMKALGCEYMALNQLEERHDGEGSVADLVGQGRQRQVDPVGLKAHTLPVERDMHAELDEQDRRQQCGPMKPRGVAWNGASGWLISQSGQVNFSRTVSISLKRPGPPPASWSHPHRSPPAIIHRSRRRSSESQ